VGRPEKGERKREHLGEKKESVLTLLLKREKGRRVDHVGARRKGGESLGAARKEKGKGRNFPALTGREK